MSILLYGPAVQKSLYKQIWRHSPSLQSAMKMRMKQGMEVRDAHAVARRLLEIASAENQIVSILALQALALIPEGGISSLDATEAAEAVLDNSWHLSHWLTLLVSLGSKEAVLSLSRSAWNRSRSYEVGKFLFHYESPSESKIILNEFMRTFPGHVAFGEYLIRYRKNLPLSKSEVIEYVRECVRINPSATMLATLVTIKFGNLAILRDVVPTEKSVVQALLAKASCMIDASLAEDLRRIEMLCNPLG